MLWKAWEAYRASQAERGGDALLLGRIALVEALVGALALAAAVIAALALRPRPRRRTLDLGGARPGQGEGPLRGGQ
jgi:hypothetical protein